MTTIQISRANDVLPVEELAALKLIIKEINARARLAVSRMLEMGRQGCAGRG